MAELLGMVPPGTAERARRERQEREEMDGA
jgi:hypothetical protein